MSRVLLRYIISFLLVLTCIPCPIIYAQALNNDWWSHDKQYLKFEIDRSGVYKIDLKTLREVGLPIDQINPNQIELWSYGQLVRIFVSSEEALTDDDFIYFYGKANDGSLDQQLYNNPERQQLNPEFSLYTNRRPYFLTWSQIPNPNNLRFRVTSNGFDQPGIPPKEEYYLHHEKKVYHEFFNKPSYNGRDFIRYSDYDSGEGFGRKLEHKYDIKIPISDLAPFGIDPVLKMRIGTNVHSRSLQILANDRIIKNLSVQGYDVVEFEETLDRSFLASDTLIITVQPLGSEKEKSTVGYYDLSYPRLYTFNKETEYHFVQQASIIPRLVEINNFSNGSNNPILFNLTQGEIIYPEITDDEIQFISPSAFTQTEWYLINGATNIASIENFQRTEFDTIKSAQYLIVSDNKFAEEVAEYASYRRSEQGGNYNVAVVDINDLTNRYSYGVEGHPTSLKYFIQNLRSLNEMPEYLFIIGKGLEYTELRDERYKDQNIVTTWGIPGSDNMFVAPEGENYPSIPIGRIAVQSGEEIRNYLQKIRLHESPDNGDQTIESQKWKKSIAHLSGGSSDIQNLLFNYLNDMGDVISNNTFGGDVFTFRKTSSDPIQTVASEEIISTINDGISLLTFFGHSAVGTFDFSLEDPSKYNNAGKNPILLSLGCHSGNIFSGNRGISEQFVLHKDMGATVFLASSGTAYINPQYNMGLNLYQLLGEDLYGSTIGMVVKEALKKRANEGSISIQTLLQQFTLHGDPAYRFKIFDGPDYIIDHESVRVLPDIINSTTRDITVEAEVVNIGKTIDNELDLVIIHEFGDDQKDTTHVTIPSPAYSQTISVDIPNPGFDAVGKNQIQIILDPENQIMEHPDPKAEKNNRLIKETGEEGHEFFILDNTASPVFPEDFGIINNTANFELIASINNAFDPGGEFILEIDTSQTFESPWKKETIIQNTSSLIKWSPDIDYEAGRVYYWRIAPQPTEFGLKSNTWKSRSFVYLPDSPTGWNQSHYYQWLSDDFFKTILDTTSRRVQYAERQWDIRIKNRKKDPNDFWVFVNNSPWRSLNPKELAPGIGIFAWHKEEVIISNSGSDYGSIPYSPDGFIYNPKTTTDRENIVKLLESIPEGARVFLHTLIEDEKTTLNIEDWQNDKEVLGYDLFEILENYGSIRVRELEEKGAVPFTMIFDKGQGLVVEDVGENIESTIDLSSKATSTWNEGTIISVPVGPAKSWKQLIWTEQKEGDDISFINVYGLKKRNGTKDLLIRTTDEYSIDLSEINSAVYPYIAIEYDISDPDRTSSTLDYWRVLYDALPDAALYSNIENSFMLEDTVNAGEEIEISFDIMNLGNSDLEPILVRYRMTDESGKQNIFVKRAEKVPAHSKIQFTEYLQTDGLGGKYIISVELNPNEDQPELTLDNNFGQSQLYVRPDNKQPFLNVTFNNQVIQNGHITGPNPEIKISLSDPESYVLLDNPDDFKITLYYPEVFVRDISESDPDVTFMSANNIDDNTATFFINPNLSVYGEYILNVNAKDPAGNPAGLYNYQVTFNVEERTTEEPFNIWPNPFKDDLTFEFYIDDMIPEIFYLRIFTADGKQVKRVDKEDFGGLFYGVNRYLWDGLDDSGNILPTGIYFYEIINNLDSRQDKKKGRIFKIN